MRSSSNHVPPSLSRILHACGATIAALLLLLAWGAVYAPLHIRSAELRASVQESEQLLEHGSQEIAERQRLDKEFQTIQYRLRGLSDQLPPQMAESAFLGQLTPLANGKVLLRDYRSGAVTRQTGFEQQQISVTIIGDYAHLCRFLVDVEQLPRLCNISMLRMRPYLGDTHTVSAEVNLHIFSTAPANSLGG